MPTKSQKAIWRFNNQLSELNEWLHWARKTAEQYRDELKVAREKASGFGLTDEALASTIRVGDSLEIILKEASKVEKEVRRMRGKVVAREGGTDGS